MDNMLESTDLQFDDDKLEIFTQISDISTIQDQRAYHNSTDVTDTHSSGKKLSLRAIEEFDQKYSRLNNQEIGQ